MHVHLYLCVIGDLCATIIWSAGQVFSSFVDEITFECTNQHWLFGICICLG